jgi:hypothetical protein
MVKIPASPPLHPNPAHQSAQNTPTCQTLSYPASPITEYRRSNLLLSVNPHHVVARYAPRLMIAPRPPVYFGPSAKLTSAPGCSICRLEVRYSGTQRTWVQKTLTALQPGRLGPPRQGGYHQRCWRQHLGDESRLRRKTPPSPTSATPARRRRGEPPTIDLRGVSEAMADKVARLPRCASRSNPTR